MLDMLKVYFCHCFQGIGQWSIAIFFSKSLAQDPESLSLPDFIILVDILFKVGDGFLRIISQCHIVQILC